MDEYQLPTPLIRSVMMPNKKFSIDWRVSQRLLGVDCGHRGGQADTAMYSSIDRWGISLTASHLPNGYCYRQRHRHRYPLPVTPGGSAGIASDLPAVSPGSAIVTITDLLTTNLVKNQDGIFTIKCGSIGAIGFGNFELQSPGFKDIQPPFPPT